MIKTLLLGIIVFSSIHRAEFIVRDSRSEPIRNATIRLVNSGPPIEAQPVEGSPGMFSAEAPAGEYTLEIAAPGFTTVRQQIRIAAAPQVWTVLMASETGGPVNQIPLEPHSNPSATIVPAAFLQSLPEDQQEFEAALNLFAGPRTAAPDLVVDGLPGGYFPPRDQLREAWFSGNRFTTEFGRPAPVRIEAITQTPRSGLHSMATFAFRDEALNAADPLSGRKPPFQSRNLRAVVSDRLLNGKLPVSLSARRDRRDTADVVVQAVTPSGAINEPVAQGSEIHHYDARGAYRMSEQHGLAFNLEYGSHDSPINGVGGLNLRESGYKTLDRHVEAGLRETARLSTSLTNALRLQWNRDTARATPFRDGAAIFVTGAFIGGGASTKTRDLDSLFQLNDHVLWRVGPAVLKAGFDFAHHRRGSSDESSFRGAFTFASLQDYQRRAPLLFTQASGDPQFNWSQSEFGGYAEVDWRVRARLSLTMGLRTESQSGLRDKNNWDPRVGFAYALQPTLVVRGGFGLFHERVTADVARSFLTAPGTRPLLSVLNPSFPDPLQAGVQTQTILASSRAVAAASLPLPYFVETNLVVEKVLGSGKSVSAAWEFSRGNHLLRVRDTNAPYPGAPLPEALTRSQVDLLRPDPSKGPGYQEESSASSRYHALNLGFRWTLRRVEALGNYWLSSSFDDPGRPSNNYDLSADWSRSDNFQRHYFKTGIRVRAPWSTAASLWIHARSGLPYTITTGRNDNGDGFANDRPPGVPRNSQTGPSLFLLDLHLSKRFASSIWGRETLSLTVFGYAQNVLNRTNLETPVGVLTSPLFGRSFTALPPRSLEVGVKLEF